MAKLAKLVFEPNLKFSLMGEKGADYSKNLLAKILSLVLNQIVFKKALHEIQNKLKRGIWARLLEDSCPFCGKPIAIDTKMYFAVKLDFGRK